MLKEARFELKTQLGTSDEHYSHKELHPLYGIGQGAGNSPAVWAMIRSTLFTLYDENAEGAVYHSPDHSIQVKVFMVSFVDDTSSSMNDFLQPSLQRKQHYLQQAQSNTQCWNDILQLSGGALQLSKCSYCFLFFKFSDTGVPYLSRMTMESSIALKFLQHNTPKLLKHISTYDSHKILGVYKSPVLQKKAYAHAAIISWSPLTIMRPGHTI